MRILHLIDADAWEAGVFALAADALARLDHHQSDVLIIGDASQMRLAARCGLRPLGGVAPVLGRTALARHGLRRFVRAQETIHCPYDLLHAWSMPAAALAASVAPNTPIIAGPLTNPPGPSISKRAIARINRCAVRVLSATPQLQRDWTAIGVDPLLVTLQVPGVDRKRLAPEDRAMLRGRWGADETTFVVGLLGEPAGCIDVQTAVMAAVRVTFTGRSVKLLTHHAAGLRQPAANWAQRVGLGDLLMIEDGLAQPWTVAPGLDAALIVGRRFACGLLPGLWAIAAGVPVIADTAQPIAEVLEDGSSGLLVDRGDINAIARSILQLHDDTALTKRLSQAAKQLVEDRFDADTFAKSLDDVYHQVFRGQRVVTTPQLGVPQTRTPAKTAVPVTHH